jgi:hypothetical protein
MVITAREEARKEHEAVVRKNEQLKAQLADTESLLKNHQEQLAELKSVMEQMSIERDDQTIPTEPSTPGLRLGLFDSSKDNLGVAESMGTGAEAPEPSYPTSFTHLIQPILRTDLVFFEDFQSLLRMPKAAPAPGSRVSSGSYVGLGIGLGLASYIGPGSSSTVSVIQPPSVQSPSNASTTTTSTPATTPTTPASATSNSSAALNSLTPLKETKFYKRVLAEDIEPCLRLDTAPGLSWLARRSVLNSMCDGSLVVEPMPTSSKKFALSFACSLCGENRKTEQFARNHRFRTSESENSQRYPLCKYCLGRVRSSCDFLGFLRMLKDGHWRAEGEEAERAAWDESVRLREGMFWARIGGGVIPTSFAHNQAHQDKSPRVSNDIEKIEMLKLSKELERTGEIKPRDITPITVEIPKVTEEKPLIVQKEYVKRDDTAAGLWNASQDDAAAPPSTSFEKPSLWATASSTEEKAAQDVSAAEDTEVPNSTTESVEIPNVMVEDAEQDDDQSTEATHADDASLSASSEEESTGVAMPGGFN